MTAKETSAQSVIRIAGLYHRGIICPGETWNMIFDAVGGFNVDEILDELPPEEQQSVRAIHFDRPESLPILAELRPALNSQVTSFLHWCQRGKQ